MTADAPEVPPGYVVTRDTPTVDRAERQDNRFDACVLAETPRAARRARRDLAAHRGAACNQLRAHLDGCFPGAVGLFAELDSPISLAFPHRKLDAEIAGQLALHADILARAWLPVTA
jgi:transposase